MKTPLCQKLTRSHQGMHFLGALYDASEFKIFSRKIIKQTQACVTVSYQHGIGRPWCYRETCFMFHVESHEYSDLITLGSTSWFYWCKVSWYVHKMWINKCSKYCDKDPFCQSFTQPVYTGLRIHLEPKSLRTARWCYSYHISPHHRNKIFGYVVCPIGEEHRKYKKVNIRVLYWLNSFIRSSLTQHMV